MIKPYYLVLIVVLIYPSYVLTGETRTCGANWQMSQQVCPGLAPLPGQNCASALEILALLTPPTSANNLNLPQALTSNLYKSTLGPVTRRSLLDEPALIYMPFDACYWSLIIEPFYNYSPRVVLINDSPFIEDYIDVSNENIVNEITKFDLGGINPDILGAAGNIRIQQHRLGFMFGANREWECWNCNLRFPIYYLAEHYFLTPDELNELTFQSSSGPRQERQFLRNHLFADKVGMGDTRLTALYKLYESTLSTFWFGVQMTLPTACTFTSGIEGASFSSNCQIPSFNLKRLFNLHICTTNPWQVSVANMLITQEATNFLLGALDRLSANLINAPMGNGGHVGIGPQCDLWHRINDCWAMHLTAVCEIFSPRHETRFFLPLKNPADFNRDYADPATAEENLAFLNQQIINTFYTMPVTIDVRPGLLFKARQSFEYEFNHFQASGGFDYWLQKKEEFGEITKGYSCCMPLDIQLGCRPAAQQGKLFGTLGYANEWCTGVDYQMVVAFDMTIFQEHIGKNYTLGLRFGFDF